MKALTLRPIANGSMPAATILRLTVGAVTAKTIQELVRDELGEVGYILPKGEVLRVFVVSGNLNYGRMGVDPTTANGMPLAANSSQEFIGEDIDKVKFISQSGNAEIAWEVGDRVSS